MRHHSEMFLPNREDRRVSGQQSTRVVERVEFKDQKQIPWKNVEGCQIIQDQDDSPEQEPRVQEEAKVEEQKSDLPTEDLAILNEAAKINS